jgi:homoserine kinase
MAVEKKYRTVTVFAPASLSNLGPGFDVLGVALEQPGDIVVAKRKSEQGLSFNVDGMEDNQSGSEKKNVAAHVAGIMLQEFMLPFGLELTLHKKMPIGSGLGSSAASSVAAAVAVNALLPKPLKKPDLLRFCVEGERLASGSPHADNAAPSLFGGACLIRSYKPLDVVQIPVKNSFWFAVVHPHIVVMTKTARKILPRNVSLRKAVNQWGNVSGLTVALMTGDARLFGKCMDDVIIEPVRAKLVPGFFEAKATALSHGAFGCTLTGSGPSMFAVAPSKQKAREIGMAMARTFSKVSDTKSDVFISRINMEGAKVVSY